MPKSHRAPRRNSWQTPRLAEKQERSCFIISASAADPALVEFIAQGLRVCQPAAVGGRSTIEQELLTQPLRAELAQAVASLRPGDAIGPGDAVLVHCRGAALDTPSGSVGLVCALGSAGNERLPAPLTAEALKLHSQHLAIMAKQQAGKVVAEMGLTAHAESVQTRPAHRDAARGRVDQLIGAAVLPAVPDPAPLLSLLPAGIVVKLGPSGRAEEITRRIFAMSDRHNPPPRDGCYEVTIGMADRTRIAALVTWKPHKGPTPYPEIRGAVEHRLPAAVAQPRSTAVAPPYREVLLGGACVPHAFNPHDRAWMETLCDLAFTPHERGDAAARTSERLRAHGLDTVGWYQPYHEYAEQAWGIYIDARALDDLSCSISVALAASEYGCQDDRLAAILAFMLVYQHQLFHARVEAILSWSELQALRPKYRPYAAKVQVFVTGTDGALEEALANYWASTWVDAEIAAGQKLGRYSMAGARGIRGVIDVHLDLAPTGHRRWREASDIFKVLATQMVQARPTLGRFRMALPLDRLLLETVPFEFVEVLDLPLRFVDSGTISSALTSIPIDAPVDAQRT
jgi:hypothetical protein